MTKPTKSFIAAMKLCGFVEADLLNLNENNVEAWATAKIAELKIRGVSEDDAWDATDEIQVAVLVRCVKPVPNAKWEYSRL